jgi:uncharacterized membrane-anchored protein
LADLIGSTTLFAMVADLSLAAKAVDSDTFVAAHKSAVVNIAKVGTGARTYNPIGMKDLIDAGTVKVGQVMTGANDVKGTVLADGKVSTTKAGKVFVGSVSATAGHHKGASQNGWEFWRIDGTLINTLR